MYFVYILRCNNNSLYTGITSNLAQRLETHTKGSGSKYVRAHLPFTLVYTEKQPDHSVALQREAAIKKLSKQAKEALILNSPFL